MWVISDQREAHLDICSCTTIQTFNLRLYSSNKNRKTIDYYFDYYFDDFNISNAFSKLDIQAHYN